MHRSPKEIETDIPFSFGSVLGQNLFREQVSEQGTAIGSRLSQNLQVAGVEYIYFRNNFPPLQETIYFTPLKFFIQVYKHHRANLG